MPFTNEEIKNLTRIALDQPPVWPEKKKLDGFRFTILLLEGELTYESPYMTLDGEIDWGDGTIETVTIKRSRRSHTYTSLGPFQIIVRGNLTEFAALQNYRMISVDTPFPKTMAEFTADSWFISSLGIFLNCENLVSIPERLFSECLALKTAKNCFNNCKSLASVPKELFMNCAYITNFEGCFQKCSSLATVGSNIFYNCWSAQNFKSCFSWCVSLSNLPSGLFQYLPRVYAQFQIAENFEDCFYKCESLITVPEKLFSGLYYATTFKECFAWCESLSYLPNNMFYCPSNTTFESCFQYCKSLSVVPASVFGDCRLVKSFKACFDRCTSLSVLEDMFNGATGATDFSYCFYNSGVMEIPQMLFHNCDSAENFSYCFANCKGLTELKYEWYHHKTNTSAKDFSYCFINCTGLTNITAQVFSGCEGALTFSHCFSGAFTRSATITRSITAAVFIGCSSAEDFSYCFSSCYLDHISNPYQLFSGCTSAKNFSHCFEYGYKGTFLNNVLEGFFDSCALAEDFSYCFYETDVHNVDPNLFANCPNANDFSYCFYSSSIGLWPYYEGYNSAPELWLTHPTALHSLCFHDCVHAANYSNIPSDWK